MKSRTVRSFTHISLDGYYLDSSGDMGFAHKPPGDEEWNELVTDNASGGASLLFGRRTYEMMTGFWTTPAAAQAMPEVAASINAMRKIVFSRTMDSASWSNPTR